MLSVSFTASRNADRPAWEGVMLNVLATGVPFADCYITGACTGGDAMIGWWLLHSRPEAEHVVIVPADRSRVDPWWERFTIDAEVTVIAMPRGTTYADRNKRLVEADQVFAFPEYPEADPRSRRSGTWQTARMARRAGKLAQWHCVKPPYSGWRRFG